MRNLIFIAALVAFGITEKGQTTPDFTLSFNELPYAEGTLLVSVTAGDRNILMEAIEVDSSSVSIPVDFTEFIGLELTVSAFQDLDDNRQLGFDNYGRPTEPCLKTTLTPTADKKVYPLKVVQY